MVARLITLLLCGFAVLGSPGCRKPQGRPTVVVSIFPIYDLVRRVAGPDADVSLMLPPGKSAPGFTPGAHETELATKARLGVMVGLGLDGWMDAVLKEAAPDARVLKVGDRVPTLTIKDDAIDPHVWLDPQRARLAVKAIGEELARTDASHANAYRHRASEVDASLEALDKEIEQATATWKNRAIVTPDESFGYFAERYKVSFVREAQGPSAAKVPAGALDPLGGSAETDTYEKLIRYDVAQIAKALR